MKRYSILFVCMGNICRSPLAANVFRYKIKQRGVENRFTVDSAGTGGWHAGELPDPRVRRVAAAKGVPMTGTARQSRREDFQRFDLLLCMDDENREHLLAMGAPPEKVRLLLELDSSAECREVPDPYYGDDEDFDDVVRICLSACEPLLARLQREHRLKRP